MAMESDPVVKSQACFVLNRIVKVNPESIQAASSALKQSEREALGEFIEADVQTPELHATNPPATPPASHSRRTSAISNVSLESRHSAVKDFVKAQREAMRSTNATPTPGEPVVELASTPTVSYVSGVYVEGSPAPISLAVTPQSIDGSPRRRSNSLLSRDASYNQALSTVEETEKNTDQNSVVVTRRKSSSLLPQPSRLSGHRFEDTVAGDKGKLSETLKVESVVSLEIEQTVKEKHVEIAELHVQGVQLVSSQITETSTVAQESKVPEVVEPTMSAVENQEAPSTSPLIIQGQQLSSEPATITTEDKVDPVEPPAEDVKIVETVVQTCLQEIGLVLQEPSPISPILMNSNEVAAIDHELGLVADAELLALEPDTKMESNHSEREDATKLEIEGVGLSISSAPVQTISTHTMDTHFDSETSKQELISNVLGQLESAHNRPNLKASLEQLQLVLKTAKGIDASTSSKLLRTTLTCQKNLVFFVD
jgi:hypothetical protein